MNKIKVDKTQLLYLSEKFVSLHVQYDLVLSLLHNIPFSKVVQIELGDMSTDISELLLSVYGLLGRKTTEKLLHDAYTDVLNKFINNLSDDDSCDPTIVDLVTDFKETIDDFKDYVDWLDRRLSSGDELTTRFELIDSMEE